MNSIMDFWPELGSPEGLLILRIQISQKFREKLKRISWHKNMSSIKFYKSSKQRRPTQSWSSLLSPTSRLWMNYEFKRQKVKSQITLLAPKTRLLHPVRLKKRITFSHFQVISLCCCQPTQISRRKYYKNQAQKKVTLHKVYIKLGCK